MDYNKLQTFTVVAELGSVTAAARKLRRSQSAVSQTIQALESELRLRLLERRKSRVYLSPDGERIHELARRTLGTLRDGILGLQASSAAVEGHITLGALNDFGTDFDVGRAIGSFVAAHPRVTFSLVTGTSPSLEQALVDNRVDLGFLVVFREPGMFIRAAVEKSWHSLYTSTEYARAHAVRVAGSRGTSTASGSPSSSSGSAPGSSLLAT